MERTCTLHCENNAWLHAISEKLDKILVLRRDSVCFLQLSSLMQMGRASFKSMPATRDNLFSNIKVRSSVLISILKQLCRQYMDFQKEQCCDSMSASCADAINAVHCLAHLPLLLLGSPASSCAPHSHRECFLQAQESARCCLHRPSRLPAQDRCT